MIFNVLFEIFIIIIIGNDDDDDDDKKDNYNPWRNAFYMPEKLKLDNNYPKITFPSDITNVIRFIISMITNSFQLSDQISENTKKTTTSSGFTQDQFNVLIKSHQTVIKNLMEMLLNKIYKNINQIISKGSFEILNLLEDQVDPDEMKTILSDIKIEWVFNDEPSYTVEQIVKLFESGLIPKEVAQRKILPKFGIDAEECIGCKNESIQPSNTNEQQSPTSDATSLSANDTTGYSSDGDYGKCFA